MQACTAQCLALLSTQQVVSKVTIENCYSSNSSSLSNTLRQLSCNLVSNAALITPAQGTASAADNKQHMQFIQACTALVAAVVGKLTMLETTTQADISGPGKAGIEAAQLVYGRLMCLLCTSVQLFECWPSRWPVSANYTTVRAALYSYMQFLHAYTLNHSSMWCTTMDAWPQLPAKTLFNAPLIYIISIASWLGKDPQNVAEIVARPCGFFTLACCVALGQAEGRKASWARETALFGQPPLGKEDVAIHMFVLGQCLAQFCKSVEASQRMQTLITPAALALLKKTFMLYAGMQGDKVQVQLDITMNTLTYFLRHATAWTAWTERQPGTGLELPESNPDSNEGVFQHSSVLLTSDVALLRVLLDQMQSQPSHMEEQCKLVFAIVCSWQDGKQQCLQFPSPSIDEQIRGIYLIAHYCMTTAKAWMKHQQHLRQGISSACSCTPSQHTFTTQQRETIRLMVSNKALCIHIKGLAPGPADADAGLGDLIQPAHDPVLLKVQHVLHMPGSVMMVEASVRGAHRPDTASSILDSVGSFASALIMFSGTASPDSLPACVGYASTLRKLLSTLLRPMFHSFPNQPLDISATVSARLPDMIFGLQQKIREIDSLKEVPLPHVFRHGTSTVASSVNLSPAFQSARASDFHQLAAVALAMLVQMCHCRLEAEQAWGSDPSQQPPWLNDTICDVGELSMGLGLLASTLLQGAVQASVEGHTKVDTVWEQYAVDHFNGRLMRGCCYMGCNNLDGVSEAALKTQLCSCCRRARYCSVECQRSAWCKGGHKNVCSYRELCLL